jgi:hypothetical protein
VYAQGYNLPEKVLSYSASIQQTLPDQSVLTVAYVGSQGRNGFQRTISNRIVGVSTNSTNGNAIINAAANPKNGTDWSDVTFVHTTRWQAEPFAQIGANNAKYPSSGDTRAWQIWRDRGAHVSLANLIEMQMRHGMPPFQEALNHGILPSLSPDVDANMTTDAFSLMRGAFCLQRALANDLAFKESNPGNLPVPQLLTSRQCIEMVTIAGAAATGLSSKVGTLTPGKEADIVVLEARSINTWPMNNVPGTIVTMMNPRHVRDVLIAGKVVCWKHGLVGWNVERVLAAAAGARPGPCPDQRQPGESRRDSRATTVLPIPIRPNFWTAAVSTEHDVADAC